MADGATHDERTTLAWARTWLAAAVGVAVTLRLGAPAGAAAIVPVALVLVAGGLVLLRRPELRAAALVVVVALVGTTTALHAVLQLMWS